jgi:hypothetical protein
MKEEWETEPSDIANPATTIRSSVGAPASHDGPSPVMSCSMGQLIAMTEWSLPRCQRVEKGRRRRVDDRG